MSTCMELAKKRDCLIAEGKQAEAAKVQEQMDLRSEQVSNFTILTQKRERLIAEGHVPLPLAKLLTLTCTTHVDSVWVAVRLTHSDDG